MPFQIGKNRNLDPKARSGRRNQTCRTASDDKNLSALLFPVHLGVSLSSRGQSPCVVHCSRAVVSASLRFIVKKPIGPNRTIQLDEFTTRYRQSLPEAGFMTMALAMIEAQNPAEPDEMKGAKPSASARRKEALFYAVCQISSDEYRSFTGKHAHREWEADLLVKRFVQTAGVELDAQLLRLLHRRARMMLPFEHSDPSLIYDWV